MSMQLTARQQDRRRRVLDAVIALGDERGVDGISMQQVADRSGVALATIYRYFSSKDHLVAAALLDWAQRLERGQPPEGDPAERLTALLHRAMRAYERQPAFARMLLVAAHSPDPNAGACFAELGRSVNGLMANAIAELDPGERERVLRVLDAVWYHALVEWVHGRKAIADVHDLLDTAADLLLRGARPFSTK